MRIEELEIIYGRKICGAHYDPAYKPNGSIEFQVCMKDQNHKDKHDSCVGAVRTEGIRIQKITTVPA